MQPTYASRGRQDPGAHGAQVATISPITFSVPARPVDLQLRVSYPVTGDRLPVILFSHGHGGSSFLRSYRGYGPLVDYFAAQGFVVIQPTHLNSATLSAEVGGPDAPLFWQSRPRDMHFIMDNLREIASMAPGLGARMDASRVAAVGHSLGGHTVAMLAGMRVVDPATGDHVDLTEKRLKAHVMIGMPGGGADLAPFAAEHYPVLKSTMFEFMELPALIVNGTKDKNPNFSDRDDWRADAYKLGPSPKSLLSVVDAEHIFGGISGYDGTETTDHNLERVAFVRESILAYIRSALEPANTSWTSLRARLTNDPNALGSIESK